MDNDGEVLESGVAKTPNKKAELNLIEHTGCTHLKVEDTIADYLNSNGAPLTEICTGGHQQTCHWVINRAENPDLPF